MDQKRTTNMEVKRNNRNRIFRYIRRHDTVSNPDISYELKMSLPTVTQITRELIERGLVEEQGELQSTGGRRAKALAVSANARQAVGLDITRNHISLVLVNLTGEILQYQRIFLPYPAGNGEPDGAGGNLPNGFEAYYQDIAGKLEAFLDTCGADREKILGLGISFPGIIDLAGEQIADSHILGIRGLPFAWVTRFFPYPCQFLNDANAGAYAEGIQPGGMNRFFYLSLSNSVGGAVFSDGRLEQGKHFRCGEVGHMTVSPDGEACYCGKLGCLDAYCAASRLSDRAGGKLDGFFASLDQGDQEAAAVWDRYTTCLAIAVNNIHMILDCDMVLGGYVGSYLEHHIQDIRDKVSARNTFGEDSGFVKACRYKTEAAALGAALKIMESFAEQV